MVKYKLLAQMVQHTADANPNKKWMSSFLGVVASDVVSQTDSTPMLLAIVSDYRMMCAAIDELAGNGERVLAWCLDEIHKLENGEVDEVDSSTEAFFFVLRRNQPIIFEFQYGENGPEKVGEVTLAQFKLAVRTYLQFLRDPERRPLEVPFPE